MASRTRNSILLLSVFAISHAVAQTGTDLGPQSVEVTGDYAPAINEAHKMIDLPVMDDSIPPAPKLTYNIMSKQVPVNFQLEPIQPATMKGEPLVKLYNHLAKVGLGNYNTPYAEYWYNTRRSKKLLVGANAGHISSSADIRDYGKAKNSTNKASVFSKFFLDKNLIDASAGYKNDGYRLYGFNRENLPLLNVSSDAFDRKKVYNVIDAKVGAISLPGDSSQLNHHESLKYYYFGDNNKWKENAFVVNGGVSKFVNSELFGGDVSFQYYQVTGLTGKGDNFILAVNPYVSMNKPKIQARLGAMVGLEHDTASSTYFYPAVKAEYRAVDEVFTVFAELTGGPTRNSYRSLAEENPFLAGPFNLKNSRERFGAGLGVKGLIGSDLTYNVSGKYRHVEDEYFFAFEPNDLFQNSFTTIYDDADEIFVHGELAFKSTERIDLILKGDYFKYNTVKEARPWYRPEYTVGLSGKYNLESKIILRADIFYVGARYGKVLNLDQNAGFIESEVKLQGYADLNLGAEYRYNKRLGMFLNLNNLAGSRYFRYVNYPVYRLNFLAGISYSF